MLNFVEKKCVYLKPKLWRVILMNVSIMKCIQQTNSQWKFSLVGNHFLTPMMINIHVADASSQAYVL